MPDSETKSLVAELGSKHGIRIDEDDPAVAMVALNRIVLERISEQISERIRMELKEFEEAVNRVERHAGRLVAQEFNEHLDAVRSSAERHHAGWWKSQRDHLPDRAGESLSRHDPLDRNGDRVFAPDVRVRCGVWMGMLGEVADAGHHFGILHRVRASCWRGAAYAAPSVVSDFEARSSRTIR
jgi:hypothetical protein